MGLWSRSPQTGFSPGQEAAIPGLRGLRKSEKLYPVDSVDFTAGCALRSRHFVKIMDCYLCVGGDLRDHKVAETPVFHSELITAHYDANEVLLFGPVCHCQCNFSRRIIRRDNCAGAAPRFLRQNLNQEDQIEPPLCIRWPFQQTIAKRLEVGWPCSQVVRGLVWDVIDPQMGPPQQFLYP